MSDQADGLRQLVQARSGPGRRPWPSRRRARAADDGGADADPVAGPDQRQGGRGDVEPGAEPGDRAGGAGPAGRAGRRRPRPGEHRPALRAVAGARPGRRPGGRRPAGRRDRRRARPGSGSSPGRTRCGRWSRSSATRPARLVAELAGLEAGADFLLVDAGSGLGPGIATLAAAADEVVVVTTPEPTSVADAHAAIDRFRRLAGPARLRAVVNQAASAAEAGRRPRPARARRAGSSSATVVTAAGARPGRPARPAGRPDAAAVRGGVSRLGRLARRPPARPRPGRRAPAAGPPARLLRRPGGALGLEPGRPLRRRPSPTVGSWPECFGRYRSSRFRRSSDKMMGIGFLGPREDEGRAIASTA